MFKSPSPHSELPPKSHCLSHVDLAPVDLLRSNLKISSHWQRGHRVSEHVAETSLPVNYCRGIRNSAAPRPPPTSCGLCDPVVWQLLGHLWSGWEPG